MAQNLPLVFVHGLGLNSSVWQSLRNELKGYECRTIDLGFVGGGITDWLDLSEPAIYIGHSMGVLWCLANEQINPEALISINGFDCFHEFTPHPKIEAMQEGLEKNAPAQMQQFWRAIGCNRFAEPRNLNKEALMNALEFLANTDASALRIKLEIPIMALASRNDRIVPEIATINCWQNYELVWHDDATHTLPVDKPEWCAKEINRFLKVNRIRQGH